MYPDWPKSAADLVPLPQCEGPKLGPFMFKGPQQIEFLEHIGEGLHSHVFKVRIEGELYALKLFRFLYHDDWTGPDSISNLKDVNAMSAFANYAEPFYSECRAYGRLQEVGYDDLVIKCFGYVLLDEDHERVVMEKLHHLDLNITGNVYNEGVEDEELRSRFPGKDGRDPPIRGLVKELGQCDEPLTTPLAKKLLRDIIKLQQVGIINTDVADRQVINNKFSDFSTAVTIPHFMTSPELNPKLNSAQIAALEFETFQLSSNDYWCFDEMIREWNYENNGKLKFHAFPGGNGSRSQKRYHLRSWSPAKFYTLVDPRKPGEEISRKRGPKRWYYNCTNRATFEVLNRKPEYTRLIRWEFRDGYIFPKIKA